MFRFIKCQRLISVLLVLGWCLGLALPARANVPFFTTVLQYCNSYRVNANTVGMNLEGLETGNPAFYLMLPSRRNNFEQVLLVGYMASAQAMARTGLKLKTIHVTIWFPKTGFMIIMSNADVALVEKLRRGEIESHQFIRQIEWNINAED